MNAAATVRAAERTTSESTLVLIGAMLVLAGAIHVVVVPEHLDHWVPFGIAFAVLAALQFALAVVLYRAPTVGRLRFAADLSTAVVLVWILSRTTGLPVGPDAGRAEAAAPIDVAATVAELHVAFSGWWLTRLGKDAVDLPPWAMWAALWILVGGVAALTAGSGAHH